MSLPWAIGAHHGSTCLVVQVAGVVGTGVRERQYAPPSSYSLPMCFAVVRWNGLEVGRTTCCGDLNTPTWQNQVPKDSVAIDGDEKLL